tara:strand:+ start:490 stop:636 length:147 start_codon:yes stop_codon:yes gene_type:complete
MLFTFFPDIPDWVCDEPDDGEEDMYWLDMPDWVSEWLYSDEPVLEGMY